MTENIVMELAQGALMVTLSIAVPLLAASFVVGLVVSIIQTVTQVHEATLSFVPKLAIFVIVLALLGPWMLQNLIRYTATLFNGLGRFAG
jgi:flagellar biosynthetic protein FliQ